jgi:hypothetical protein
MDIFPLGKNINNKLFLQEKNVLSGKEEFVNLFQQSGEQ